MPSKADLHHASRRRGHERLSTRELLAASRGFSLIEVALVATLTLVLAVIAVPMVQSALFQYRLRAAVATAAWAIQATRYQAIMRGYPFAITFDPATTSYQVSSQPPGAAEFTNVGSAVPISGSPVTLSQKTVLQFRPNGVVQVTSGQMNFSVSYHGSTKTITVSSYGNVTITP